MYITESNTMVKISLGDKLENIVKMIKLAWIEHKW